MAKKFIFDDEPHPEERVSYMDGFRFGFGMFIAWLLGFLILSGLAAIAARLFRLHF